MSTTREGPPTRKRIRLTGWKIIAAWLHLEERAARSLASRRYPEADRLPVWRLRPEVNAPICIYLDQLEEWEARMSVLRRVSTR